jgi:hypothetical protein
MEIFGSLHGILFEARKTCSIQGILSYTYIYIYRYIYIYAQRTLDGAENSVLYVENPISWRESC